MTELISCIWILMELITTFFLCGSGLKKRKWTWCTYALIMGFWLLLFIFSNYIPLPIPPIYITLFVYLALSFICFKGPWIRHFLAAIMSILLLAVLDTLMAYASGILLGINIEELYENKYLYLTLVTVSKGLALLIAWVVWRVRVEKTPMRVQIRWLSLALLFPIISLIMLVAVFKSFQMNNNVSVRALIFTMAISLGNVAILYLIQQLEKAEKEQLHSALLAQQMEVQTKSILALEKSYRAQRESVHEFNHRLSAIHTLLEKGQYDDVSKYVAQLCQQQSTRIFCINSHNPIIDAILNQKYQLASELGIEMQIKVNDLSGIPVPTDSIVVLLSNLLDNAMEACGKCAANKEIRVSLIMGDPVFLSMDNTSIPVSIIDGEIASTKANQTDHGYGLINVKRILQGLNAEFAFRYHDGWFSFVAEIPSR